jgi:hypothetical protein
MQNFNVSHRKLKTVSKRKEVIGLCLLALRDNQKGFARGWKAGLSTPESRRATRK